MLESVIGREGKMYERLTGRMQRYVRGDPLRLRDASFQQGRTPGIPYQRKTLSIRISLPSSALERRSELTTRMPTRKALEPIIQQMRILLRTDRPIRQAIHRRIMCSLVRLTPRDRIWPRSSNTHFDDLGDDARDGESHEEAEDGVVDVPSAAVDEAADDDYEGEGDGEGDDE
jgi:hypothetical protein